MQVLWDLHFTDICFFVSKRENKQGLMDNLCQLIFKTLIVSITVSAKKSKLNEVVGALDLNFDNFFSCWCYVCPYDLALLKVFGIVEIYFLSSS